MSAHGAGEQIMRLVLHTTPHTYSNFSPARSGSTSACVWEGAWTGSFFQLTLGFNRAVARQKLHLQFLCAIPLFTFTHDSRVMSTICQMQQTSCVFNTLSTFTEVEGIDGQPPIVSILPGKTDRLPSTTQINSSYSVHPSVHACRLGIQRKMAQAQQISSIIL